MFLTSISLAPQNLGGVKQQLRSVEISRRQGYSAVEKLKVVKPEKTLPDDCIRTLELAPFLQTLEVGIDHDGRSLSPFPIQVPSSSQDDSLGEKRWILELRIDERHLPPSRAVAASCFADHHIDEQYARITTDGTVALWCPSFMTPPSARISSTWSSQLQPPPTGLKLLERLLGDRYSISIHDKGRYLAYVVNGVGGAEDLLHMLMSLLGRLISLFVHAPQVDRSTLVDAVSSS